MGGFMRQIAPGDILIRRVFKVVRRKINCPSIRERKKPSSSRMFRNAEEVPAYWILSRVIRVTQPPTNAPGRILLQV
jgi:hypothetical protein